MLKIDSHQHFWKFDAVRDSWIDENMSVIKHDFMPEDLEPLLQEYGFDGCITVQSDQSEGENVFQLANADRHDFIKGVVGWVDLQRADIEERLSDYKKFNKLKGFRHILQGERERDFMLRPAFLNGVKLLNKFDFSYDILIFPDQLAYISNFVAQFPEQRFVIDHLAKPNIKIDDFHDWEKGLKHVAQFENVVCKVSGMVTEADWKNWKQNDFTKYLDVAVEAFGMDRLLYGSDWPVCKLAADYGLVYQIVKKYFSDFSEYEQQLFWGGNAQKLYRIT